MELIAQGAGNIVSVIFGGVPATGAIARTATNIKAGGIQFEGKLTGIVLTAGVPAGEPQHHATEVAPGVAAGYHQHFFTARLDMDVDGERNVAFEVDSAPAPAGPDNPEGSAFTTHRRTFQRESQAMRDVAPLQARRWRVDNPARRNRMNASRSRACWRSPHGSSVGRPAVMVMRCRIVIGGESAVGPRSPSSSGRWSARGSSCRC